MDRYINTIIAHRISEVIQLFDYYERKINGLNEEIINGKEKDTVFNFRIDDMAHRENIAEIMNYYELYNGQKSKTGAIQSLRSKCI